MKNSNSRDKNVRTMVPTPTDKLMKTDVQQPRREQLQRTNYNRPASGKKIESSKNMPPKVPMAKKQYVIQDNMTESRITEAKQGLQLLKKKMSSKGLSKQKTGSSQIQKPITSLKTLGSTKNQETQYYENRNNNMPPKKLEKKVSQPDEYSRNQKPPMSTKTMPPKNLNDRPTPQNERKQPPASKPTYQQYRNEQLQIPIKPKKDFNALLEQQLRKQKMQNKSGSIPMAAKQSKNTYNQMDEYPPQNGQLIPCQHCERMFAETVIQKHEKVCLKVFMSKRKAFDSAARRAPEVQGIQQVKIQNKKSDPQQKATAKKQQQTAVPAKKEEGQIPKWKAASLAFRANLKAVKGVQMTVEQKKAADVAQGLVQCNYCGRKFNEKAAQRHIPFCETKSKQLPKMNMTKKK